MKTAFTTRLKRIEDALQAFTGIDKDIDPNDNLAFLENHLRLHPEDIETENVLRAFNQAISDIEDFELQDAETINEKLAAAVLQGDEKGQLLAYNLVEAFQRVTDRRNELKQHV